MARVSAEALGSLRARAGFAVETLAAHGSARVEYFRVRRVLLDLHAERATALQELGEAVYRGDEEAAASGRDRVAALDRELEARHEELMRVTASVEERVQKAQLAVQPTEIRQDVEIPGPVAGPGAVARAVAAGRAAADPGADAGALASRRAAARARSRARRPRPSPAPGRPLRRARSTSRLDRPEGTADPCANLPEMCRRGALGLVLCLGLVLAAPAAAGDIYSRKHSVDSRIGSLQSRIDAARAREDTLSAQIAGVTAQIRRLESRVGDVSQHLATLQADLDLHKRRLARLTELYALQTHRLVFLKQQYGTAVDRLSLRLIEVYEEGEPSTVDVALSATSFSDLVDQLDYVRDLGQSDSRIASDVADARDSMRVARAKTKKVRATVGSETRVIAVRTDQVRAVRDSLLASSHKLSRAARRRAREPRVGARDQAGVHRPRPRARSRRARSSRRGSRRRRARRPCPARRRPGDSTPSSHGLIWPVNGPVTSPFGLRWGRMHEGIDIGVGYGTPIHAAASGTVDLRAAG